MARVALHNPSLSQSRSKYDETENVALGSTVQYTNIISRRVFKKNIFNDMQFSIDGQVRLVRLVHLVRLVRLQTDNFGLFLR
jgi:hypothetical protein